MQITKFIKQFAQDEEGVTAIEYGLLAALIAIVIIAGAGAVGVELGNLFNFISTELAARPA